LRDLRTVGLFAGPYRLSLALRFIPQTLSMPLYPMYSRLAHAPEGRAHLQMAYVRSVKCFFIAGLPVSILYAGCAGTMIDLLLGPKYHEALSAMRWIGAAFLPFFVSNPLPFLLTALEEQRFVLWSSIAALAVRIGLDFSLIPLCGYVGPCIAFFVSEVLLLFAMTFQLFRTGFPLPLLEVLVKPSAAAVVMTLALLPFIHASLLGVFAGATVAMAVYAAALWKLGVFSPEELGIAREGLAFMKPFLAKWSKHPVRTQS
jgi:PST family polysaccharide transporter